LLRELCFPVVSRLVDQLDLAVRDRVLAERTSSTGAVRCADLLLQRYAPGLTNPFRSDFRSAVPAESAAAFEDAFAVPSPLLDALTTELGVGRRR
jgi:hypothetical protein